MNPLVQRSVKNSVRKKNVEKICQSYEHQHCYQMCSIKMSLPQLYRLSSDWLLEVNKNHVRRDGGDDDGALKLKVSADSDRPKAKATY